VAWRWLGWAHRMGESPLCRLWLLGKLPTHFWFEGRQHFHYGNLSSLAVIIFTLHVTRQRQNTLSVVYTLANTRTMETMINTLVCHFRRPGSCSFKFHRRRCKTGTGCSQKSTGTQALCPWAGGATCGTCHSPHSSHGAAAARHPESLMWGSLMLMNWQLSPLSHLHGSSCFQTF
jgi:hypothetical protein